MRLAVRGSGSGLGFVPISVNKARFAKVQYPLTLEHTQCALAFSSATVDNSVGA
jgi:hypothetical protein